MNEELSVRLSELREAADLMQRATTTIRASVDVVRGEIAALVAQVDPQTAPSFGQLVYSGRLVELTDTLDRLSAQMTRTAADVETASRWQGPPLGVLWDRIKTRPVLVAPPAMAAAPPSYTLGSYISRANRPLYDALQADQSALTTERAVIEKLAAARAEALNERDTLDDRLRAYGETNVAAVPRMQALHLQIEAYDNDIAAAERRADTLQTRIDAATTRLLAVNPADSADVSIIAGLERGASADYVLANTRDCVNYVASRVPIPGELAANAHLWDERAADLPQLGIRVSDTPLPGSILVMETDHPYASDLYGHVMLVEQVDAAGTVWVTDHTHHTPVRLSDLTTETSGERIKYLYLPWFTRA